MARTVDQLSDRELQNFIGAYEREGKTQGGIFTLSELHVERLRRSPSARPPRDVVGFILDRVSASDHGSVTYLELWDFLMPGVPWKGNHSIRVVGSSLAAVVAYCIGNGLPLISPLVVQSGSGALARRAIENIYNEARLYGLDVGPVPEDFVNEEARKARALRPEQLP